MLLRVYTFIRQRAVNLLGAPFWARLVIFLLLCAGVILRRNLFAMDRPGVDLLVSIGIGVLTAFLAGLAGHVGTANPLYRWMFYIGGSFLALLFVVNGVRSYLTAKAAVPVETVVMRAVNEANKHTDTATASSTANANAHTDTEVSMVRDDLREATKHSDQQITAVRTDFRGSMVTVTDLISKVEGNLNSAIAKVGKPDPPERAKLQFSLWGDDGKAKFPLTAYAMKPDKDGVFNVDFSFANTSGASAEKIDFWVYVCDACTFSKEPDGFDKPPGIDDHVRHRVLPGFINSGSSFQKTTISVKTIKPLPYFEMSFKYSCQTCGAMTTDSQTVKILVLQ